MADDPDTDPATGVLHNLLGVADTEELGRAEADFTRFRLWQLVKTPVPGKYDLQHLQRVHHHLFQDVYAWAGQLRTVAIAKTGLFCLPQHIESYAAEIFGDLAKRDHLRGLPRLEFVAEMAHFYADVNALHPFREGNGRAQRAFVGQLAREAGWEIAWKYLDADRNVQASIAGFRGDEVPLRDLFDELTRPFDP